MFSTSIEPLIEPYLVAFGVPAIAVLMGMTWYKLTSRRTRPFEPTLWWMFRWSYIYLVLLAGVLSQVDYLVALYLAHPTLFIFGTVIFLFVIFTPAVLDWRRATRKEQQQLARRKDEE